MDIRYFSKSTWVSIITNAIAYVNMFVVAFGGDPVGLSDNILGVIATILAVLCAGGYALYKNNATSRFGQLCKLIQKYVKIHGFDKVFEAVVSTLQEAFEDEDGEYAENPDDEEKLPL